MFRGVHDIPFDRDVASTTLPWIIAVMVFLATLALAGALLLSAMIDRWSSNLSGTMTVQVPAAASAEESDQRVRRIVAILREAAGVERVRVLSAAETLALVEPWIGRPSPGLDLPLPRVINVGLTPGVAFDIAGLRQKLAAAVPGTTAEEHQKWLNEAIGVVRWAWRLAVVVVLLIVLAAATTIVFATRTSLRIHRNVTEVLHLIGARDQYIANQFQRHAFRLGLLGGLVGGGGAALTLIGMERLTDGLDTVQGLRINLAAWHWIVIATVPLCAAFLAAMAARYTVLRGLAKMA